MKKNFSVNIGGRVFNIDDDAYERLNQYLANLRSYFAADQGREEIISDIEMRIAELLEQKKSQGMTIVTLEQINEIIAGMGEPDQLSDEDTKGPAWTAADKSSGKLFRDPDHRLIGGVAAGTAAWFGIDPVWIRLLFVATTFMYGIGAIVYLVLWLILPEARTTSERLEMQRRIINIDNLKQEVSSAGSGIKQTGNTVLSTFGKILKFMTEVITHVFRLLLKVLKFALGASFIGLSLSIFIGLSLFYLIRKNMETGNYHLESTTPANTFSWLMPAESVHWLAYLSITLLIIGLTGMLIFLGLRIMLKWPPLRWQVLGVFGLLIIAGLAIGGGAIYQYSLSTAEKAKDSQVQMFARKGQKIHITAESNDPDRYWKPLEGTDLARRSQNVLGEIRLSIRPAPGDSLITTTIREASSFSESMASDYLSRMKYGFSYQDTLITLDPYFTFPKSDGMHHQSVEFILGIPVNTTVIVDEGLRWRMNFSEYVEGLDEGEEFIMTTSGLKLKNPPPTEHDTVN